MGLIDQRKIKFFLVIALPLVIAALGMLWSTSRMLDGISLSVDRQEAARTWQAVQSAFGAAEERLAGTVADNAHWDDAAKQSYGPIDDEWMYDTWGVGTADINYDTMYIVDADGNPITSYRNGEKFTEPPDRYFGNTLRLMLNSLPTDNSTFAVVSTLVYTPTGLAVMAAAPILPTSEDISIPAKRPHVLVLASTLTEDTLVKMSEQYIVDGLEVLPIAGPQAANYLLHDHRGNAIAMASWQARNPGDAARQSYRFSALATIIALILVMIPISVVHVRALTTLDRNEKKSSLAARHDSLSGLPNRVLLLEELTGQLTGPKPSGLALIFIDLDGFKAINDAYGHETGDKLIRAIAAGLARLVPGPDILARLGGDEFAALIIGKNAAARAETIAANILAFVKEPFDIDGRIASIGASVGIAELGDELLEPTEMMRRADIAMYDAKDAGRNCWRRFDGSSTSSAAKGWPSPTNSGISSPVGYSMWPTNRWSIRAAAPSSASKCWPAGPDRRPANLRRTNSFRSPKSMA